MRPFLVTAGLVARRRAGESGGGGGSIEWVAAGTYQDRVDALTSHEFAVPAGAQVGDLLLLTTFPFGTITSVQTNTSQSLSLLADYASAGEVGRVYGVVIAGSVPTTITVSLSAANDFQAQAFVARGVTQTGGTVLDGNAVEARANLTYNSTAAESLVLTIYTTAGSSSRAVDVATYNGTAPATYQTRAAFAHYGTLAGVHDGSTGANNIGVTWTEADTAGGRWMSVALVP